MTKVTKIAYQLKVRKYINGRWNISIIVELVEMIARSIFNI